VRTSNGEHLRGLVGRSPRNPLLDQWSLMIVVATERRVTFDESVAILPTYWSTPSGCLYKKYYTVVAVDSPRSKGHVSIVGRVTGTLILLNLPGDIRYIFH
jgi:hypothetical protein